jgi:hypothetical protein
LKLERWESSSVGERDRDNNNNNNNN